MRKVDADVVLCSPEYWFVDPTNRVVAYSVLDILVSPPPNCLAAGSDLLTGGRVGPATL